jgi:hypothetical protein
MTQFNPNNGQAAGQQYQQNNNGQQYGKRRGGYSGGPQRQYEWLVQQRLRENMRLNQLLARQQGLQESARLIQQRRDNTVAKKLGLSLVAGISVLSGLKQVTMVERSHMYKMARYDQEDVRIQAQLEQVEQDIIAAQQNLELIDFEIEMLTTGTNPGSTTPGP